MESTRSFRRHGNVYPAVFSLLADVSAGSVPHAAHGLRAPGAIYNLSVNRILAAFTATLDELDALHAVADDQHAGVERQTAKVLAAQTELLEAMLAHIDDGYQVLKACHPAVEDVHQRFADRWLEEVRHPTVRQYKKAVESYRDAIAPIVNRVKHEHGQLRLVAVVADGQTDFDGYYLEGVDPEGIVGPDPALHAGGRALSFNRDLRFHFVHLFEIGNALKAALVPALRALGQRVTGRVVDAPSPALVMVAERLDALGTTAFPDEVRKPTPQVRVHRDGDDVQLAVSYPSLATFKAPGTMVVTVRTKGDGFTTQYRFPYWQPEAGGEQEG